MHGDAVRLEQVISNLLENAVKYTEPEDTIELRSHVLDYGLVIEVIDTGSGIAPEALDRIFDRFARGDDARTRTTGGAGLGLAIVDAVAKAHGGSCTVTPRARGSAFALRIPDFQPSAQPLAAPTLDPLEVPL